MVVRATPRPAPSVIRTGRTVESIPGTTICDDNFLGINIEYCSQFVKLYMVVTDVSQSQTFNLRPIRKEMFFGEASDWSATQNTEQTVTNKLATMLPTWLFLCLPSKRWKNIFINTLEIYIWVSGGYELFIYRLVNIRIIIFFENLYFSQTRARKFFVTNNPTK